MSIAQPKPCRVLLVINHLYIGGAELQLINLARGLARLGHPVTICCIHHAGAEVGRVVGDGVELVELGAAGRLERVASVPRLVRLARRADVVHCTMWDASLWGRLAAILARRPVVVADHATDRSVQIAANGAARASWISAHNRLLDRFTYATVACAMTQHAVLEGEGVDPAKIVDIPNGVPLDDIAREARAGPTRQELGIPDGARVVIQVGVFRSEKNQLGALEAVARLRERVPDTHLVFVGDGAERQRVERHARELGGAWTHFLGFRADVPSLLSLADILLQPSLADALPMTVLEALALGVPIVATDVGDVRRVLEGGGGGIVVPAGEVDALAQACERLLTDDELRARVSAEGLDNARRFDSATMAGRYSTLLRAACAGSPHPAARAEA